MDKCASSFHLSHCKPAGRGRSAVRDGIKDDPLFTDRQKYILGPFELFGFVGLAYCIYTIWLKEESNANVGNKRNRRSTSDADDDDGDDDEINGGHQSLKKVTRDYETGSFSRMLFCLASLSSSASTAFIRGDITNKMRDPEFQAAKCSHLRCRDTQGGYAVFVAIDSPSDSSQMPSQIAPYVGRGLSLNQLRKVLDSMRLYVSTDQPGSCKLAMDFDEQSQHVALKIRHHRGERRLFTATVRYHFGNLFNVQHSTYRVFKTTKVEDIGLDEIVASAGGSTGSTANRTSKAYLDGLRRNALSILNSGFVDDNLRDAKRKIERVKKLLSFFESRDQEVEEFEAQATQTVADFEALLATGEERLAEIEAEEEERAKPEDEYLKAQKEMQEITDALDVLSS
ncbi:hypothetical protein Z517_11321 [Fonsecaea pedrosoi CBS 271.37]|uniref:Uncharacterized protein n=1 Tax=Fonsecaea pedrosoi CBS 271.37 TaxID=1442368 RepID=A0A0D2DAG5_9EURO|nr:uncharacterized protein Z517_11321 [Fonsecaea pedrosoi CBS 271.37]KIW74551.1 hypothetical protein Z517_11321 [Fonsecaea pedrosoi CBS 271.37]